MSDCLMEMTMKLNFYELQLDIHKPRFNSKLRKNVANFLFLFFDYNYWHDENLSY